MNFFPHFSLFSLSTKEVNLVQLTHSGFFDFQSVFYWKIDTQFLCTQKLDKVLI